jgi:hypothetical protein
MDVTVPGCDQVVALDTAAGIEPRPRRSGGMFVIVEDAAQTIMPMDIEACDRVWNGDRLRQRM